MAGAGLVDEVLEAVANSGAGPLTWFERLPDEAQQELLRVRAGFDPARHQKRAFYRALKAACERRGWLIAGEKQVTQWLARQR